MPRDDEKRDYLPEAASDPHLPALAPDRAKNASQPEFHDLRAEESCIEAFCAARMTEALGTLADIIDEDYAQDMSAATGIHADYFRTRPSYPGSLRSA